jgi:hypothetical protein
MKIRYQNGSAIEGLTLYRTDQTMRMAVSGRDDVMELTRIHGAWITDDCEPVTMETGIAFKDVVSDADEDFICPRELAEHLVSLLFIDVAEDVFDEQGPIHPVHPGASTLLA